jgi:hypothetical protein
VKAPPQPPVNTKIGERKMPTASTVVDDLGYVLMHVIDLFASFASEGEANPLKLH